jgi:hypothetical protein
MENQLIRYNFVKGGEEEEVGIEDKREVLPLREPVYCV